MIKKKFQIASYLLLSCFLSCQTDSSPNTNILEKEITSPPKKSEMNKNFDLQGHRGARGLFPENSIEGFVTAVELRVNTVEMDVVISKDKKVVVSHDPWINSTICWGLDDKPVPDGKGLNIYHMTYDEITNYDCGSQEHPDFPLQAKIATFKPLLKDVITEVEANAASLEVQPLFYNIEIKSTPETDNEFHPAPEEFAELVLKVINENGIHDRTIIQSFDVRALQQVKEMDASIPVALLISEGNGFEKDLN
ncbi:MAG: glycerophosphodiester phosphodiesterase [Flavobacteriales bacterium]|nr:glycerophosphodiester phosphodiesterase [Flavobacteriales bacterium]